MNYEIEKERRKNNREILLETVYWLNNEEILEVIDYCDRFITRERKIAEQSPNGNKIMEIQEIGDPKFQAANHRKPGSIIS